MGFSTIGRTDATLPPTRLREAHVANVPANSTYQDVVSVTGQGMLYGIVCEASVNVSVRVTIDGTTSAAMNTTLLPIADLGMYFGLPLKFSSQLIVEARVTAGQARDVLVRYGTV